MQVEVGVVREVGVRVLGAEVKGLGVEEREMVGAERGAVAEATTERVED